jgi:hypothetical protein
VGVSNFLSKFPLQGVSSVSTYNFSNLAEAGFAMSAPLYLITFGVGVTLAFASVQPASAAGTVGNGTPGSCTEAALNTALRGGGSVYFNCGSNPLTITVSSEKVIAANTTIDALTNGTGFNYSQWWGF